MMIIEKHKGKLVIPRNELDKIDGNKRKRISVVITDPRSRHLVLTRYPEYYKNWHISTIERGTDFIPTVVLEKAKINHNTQFRVSAQDNDLIVRRIP